MTSHVWFKCDPGCLGCQFCDGGLGQCIVCGASEGQLLSLCPGRRLNHETLEACYRGNVKDLSRFRTAVHYGAKIVNGSIVYPNVRL